MADAADARHGARPRLAKASRDCARRLDRSGRAATDRQSYSGSQGEGLRASDELRKEIERRGYEIKDNRDGTATYQRRT